jgi:hypothetical protein
MVDREEHRAEDKTDTIITYYGVLKYQRHFMLSNLQLVSKKSGNENFPNVNLVLSICQLIVYLTIPIK